MVLCFFPFISLPFFNLSLTHTLTLSLIIFLTLFLFIYLFLKTVSPLLCFFHPFANSSIFHTLLYVSCQFFANECFCLDEHHSQYISRCNSLSEQLNSKTKKENFYPALSDLSCGSLEQKANMLPMSNANPL